jgi:shikimate kinase
MTPRAVLIGLPGVGKTSTGRALARRLRVEFADSDALVEQATGRSVRELFAEVGEPGFRAAEAHAVEAALTGFPGVLALGGGAVTSAATRELLVAYGRDGGTVVWLDVDLHTAAKRVGLSRDRPILGVNPRAMLRQMLETRAPLYGEVATMTVHTAGRTPEEIATEVLVALGAGAAR